MISASTIELGYVNDFWVGINSVFVNDFCVDNKICALTISALAVELGCIDQFWVGNDSVFINDF
jgi:hypothetical protein